MRCWIAYTDGAPAVETGEWIEVESVNLVPNGGARTINTVTSYGALIRLAPGDQVVVEADQVVGIHQLAKLWLFEVYANIPDVGTVAGFDPLEWAAASEAAKKLNRQLNAAAETDAPTGGLVTKVATESRSWFDNAVRDHPHVFFYDILRTPDTEINWADEVALKPWEIRTVQHQQEES